VGPKPDGTIPEGDLGILKDTGAWLALNGEGIYDSKVWRSSGEGPTRAAEGQFQDHKRPAYRAQDFRFTVKDNAVYAFALNFPAGGRLCIRSLGPSKNHNKPSFQGIIKEVSMLGSARKPAWRLTAKGLEIEAGPDAAPLPGFPVTFKVELL
ncbi:MAG: hypothetical protein LBT11_02975, partial [Treponema sp.]|jgi:alpha-L-fucosidase|nr:hypothetical protein [Treponema sp.]